MSDKLHPLSGYLACACEGSIYEVERDARYYKCSRRLSYIDHRYRCPHYPRYLPAHQIETQVWGAIRDLPRDSECLRVAAQ